MGTKIILQGKLNLSDDKWDQALQSGEIWEHAPGVFAFEEFSMDRTKGPTLALSILEFHVSILVGLTCAS